MYYCGRWLGCSLDLNPIDFAAWSKTFYRKTMLFRKMTKKEKKIKGGKHKYIIKTILQFHFEKKECHIHWVAFVYAGVVLGWKPPH